MQELSGILGLDLWANDNKNAADDGLLNDVLELLIALRKEARAEKNYKLADDIRNRLGEIGIILEDAPTGTVWKRK